MRSGEAEDRKRVFSKKPETKILKLAQISDIINPLRMNRIMFSKVSVCMAATISALTIQIYTLYDFERSAQNG